MNSLRDSSARRPLAAYLKTPAWAGQVQTAPDNDVALSSRARLARNLSGYAFPGRATERELRRVAQEVRRAALADTEWLGDLASVAIPTLSTRDRADLVDARRISPELAEARVACYALLDEDGALSIFINEEDHLRIQVIAPGNTLLPVLKTAEEAEERLARRLHFLRHPQWGVLTTALSNMGTGLRLSALVHLPALAFLGRLVETLEAAHRLGISVRGAQGEGSQAAGDLYQVSNAVTYGLTTAHIAGRVRPVVDYLVAAERAARVEVAGTFPDQATEVAREAWSHIQRADRLEAPTALNFLSRLRLAAACGLMPLGGHTPAPDATLFATLIADLRTGGSLAEEGGATPATTTPSVRDAIQRPAKIRTALRSLYRTE